MLVCSGKVHALHANTHVLLGFAMQYQLHDTDSPLDVVFCRSIAGVWSMHVALRWVAVPGRRMALRLPSVLLQHHQGSGGALPGVRPGAAPPASLRLVRTFKALRSAGAPGKPRAVILECMQSACCCTGGSNISRTNTVSTSVFLCEH